MTISRLAIVYTRAAAGLEAPLVCVETHISRGLPQLSIVGLPEAEVRESRDRVRSAILNSKFEFPRNRITINLAPADLPKEGGRFDLAIALGILAVSDQLSMAKFEDYEFAAELSLSGKLRGIKGALPLAMATRKAQRNLIIATENAFEAAMPADNAVFAADSLRQVCDHLEHERLIKPYSFKPLAINNQLLNIDMADIQGQPHAKRALEIAAAGRHSLLLIGPPGTGKTMLASRLPTIMPELTTDEALEVAAIYSLSNNANTSVQWRQRPFRAPHHTASAVALVGGGSHPKPGEISLAHHGVLFLDELPEYERSVLEVLREPMEAGSIVISRAARKAVFPAQFQLIAAMNPCPCGQLGNPLQQCRCTNDQVLRYQAKISSPLLDRIDMHIEVPVITAELLTETAKQTNENSAQIRTRVNQAMQIQQLRNNNKLNSLLSNRDTQLVCKLDRSCKDLLRNAIEKLNLSARSYYRILKVARTIADLEDQTELQVQHLQEALSFRTRMNQNFN